MDSLSPVNGHTILPNGLESPQSTLESIASTGHVDIEWSVLKRAIKSKLYENVQMYLSSSTQISAQLEPSPFPKSSPVVPFHEDEEDQEESGRSPANMMLSSTNMSMRLGEPSGLTDNNGTTAKGLNDVSLNERLGPIDVIGGRTLPGKVNQEEAEFMESRVSRLLDEFDSDPPFTIQRLCEILIDPHSIHSSLGKHIRAIERTLLVTSTFHPPSPSDNNTIPTFSTKPNPSTVSGQSVSPRNSSAPLFSPIPFLPLQTPPPQPTDSVSTSAGSVESNETVVNRPMSPLSLELKSDQEMTELGGSAEKPSAETSLLSMPLNLTSGPTPSTSSGLIEPDQLRVDELDAGVIPDSLPLVSPRLLTSPSTAGLTTSAVSTSSSELPTLTSTPSTTSTSTSDIASHEQARQETLIGEPQPSGSTVNQRHFLANRPVALSSTTSIPDGPLLTGSDSISISSSVLGENLVRQRSFEDDGVEAERQAEGAKVAKLGHPVAVEGSEDGGKETEKDAEDERHERSMSPAIDPLRIKLTEGEEVKRV